MRVERSSNHRPGEPLRSWTAPTRFNVVDARLTIVMADAADAVQRLIDGEPSPESDLPALRLLNELSVLRWYEPMVQDVDGTPHLDRDVRDVLIQTIDERGPLERRTGT